MNPFKPAGTAVAQNFGRSDLIEKIKRGIVKDPPDLISLVGPKLFGKSVLLHHLASIFNNDQIKGYACATVITLERRRPKSDIEFLQLLSKSVCDALLPVIPDMAEILTESDEASYFDTLKLVFESLQPGQKVLLLFDNFDRLPIGTGISPNLLDQLRELASLPTFAIIIASRDRLKNICNSEETYLSEFWELFRHPIDVGAFNKDSDWETFWELFENRSINVEPGAKTELKNWTGGIPELVSAVLRQLYDETEDGNNIRHETLINCAKSLIHSESVSQLWEDMGADLQSEVVECCEDTSHCIPTTHRRKLELRGLAKFSGDRSSLTCKIIEEHARDKIPDRKAFNHLFESEINYQKNICKVLQLRLAQAPIVENTLTRYVKKAIGDLSDGSPEYVFDRCRGIIEEAVCSIWKQEELNGLPQLPKEWTDTWVNNQGLRMPEGMDPLPTDRGQQMRVLRYIAGSTQKYSRVAKKVSRHTVMLLEQLNNVGNFHNHSQGERSSIGAACAMCFIGIELLQSLASDLKRA